MPLRRLHPGGAVTVLAALQLLGCAGMSGERPAAPAPVVNPAATTSTLLAGYLELLQKLVTGPAAQQAEIVASARHDFDTAPTPSHQLRLALILGTPGHPATDLPRAQGLLARAHGEPGGALAGGALARVPGTFAN